LFKFKFYAFDIVISGLGIVPFFFGSLLIISLTRLKEIKSTVGFRYEGTPTYGDGN